MNTEIWNSSKMGGTGGALKALTKNLANQLTLNRSEMKRVVARVISERHGQGDVGDYNGHMYFVKPERIDLTQQITHSKEAFDDMIQQKRMMLSTSRNHMYNTPSGSRSRSVNMTLQSPKANKSLTGVIIDQKHLPKSGNPPEIVVQISKPRIAGKPPKRIPVTLSPRHIHVRASKRRLSLRKPRLPDPIKCTYGSGSKSKHKISRKKMLIRSHLAKIKKPLKRVNVLSVCRQPVKPLKQHQQQHQQQQHQQQHHKQRQEQATEQQQSRSQAKQESSHRLGAGASAGSKAVLAVEKAQSLVEELVSSSIALSQKKSQSLEQSAQKKQKSLPQKKKSGKLQSNKNAKSKINNGSKQKKLDKKHSSSNNKSNNSNHNNSSNINIKNSNSNSAANYSFGFKNAGKRLQAGGIMAEASKLGINTPAVNRYSKYWRNPYQFPGGAGATQMYDTAKERYAVASARSKMLAKRKQAAAAIYTNFQREQQSNMSLRRVRKNKSQAQILKQLKRNQAIDEPENLDTSISWRCLKRRRRPYKLSARMEELAKPMPYRNASPEAAVRGHSRSPVHRPKGLKQRLHRRRRQQQQQQQQRNIVVNSNTSLGSFAHLKRNTSRSGLTPAKRHLTLAFLKNDGPSQRSLRHLRSSRNIHWR